jgi:hypothetical protein
LKIPTRSGSDLRPDRSRRKVRNFSRRGKDSLSKRERAGMAVAKDAGYACA